MKGSIEIRRDRGEGCQRIASYQLKISKNIRSFFSGERFFAAYEFELEDIPDGICVLPLLSNLLPASWVLNATVVVEEADRSFLESAEEIKKGFQELYPQVDFSGGIECRRLIETRSRDGGGRSLTLFSGGVDSLTTFFSRRSEIAGIATIWGADMALDYPGGWGKIRSQNQAFASHHGVCFHAIRSNLRSFFHEYRLNKLCAHVPDFSNWWGNIQNGWGLLGLCAPLTVHAGYPQVFIPASYWRDQTGYSWGSHPLIDGKARWADIGVVHEGYDLARQQKMAFLAQTIRSEVPDLWLRVCYTGVRGDNCNRCEKCCRTIVGLMIEGLDPNSHGFRVSEETFDDFLKYWRRGTYHLSKGDIIFWQDLQNALRKKREFKAPYGASFFDWIRDVDLGEMKRLSARKFRGFDFLLNLTQYIPSWARTWLRRRYRSLKRFFAKR